MDDPVYAPTIELDYLPEDDGVGYGVATGDVLACTFKLFGVKHHMTLVAVDWRPGRGRTIVPRGGDNQVLQRIIDRVLHSDCDVYGWAPGDVGDPDRHQPAFIRVPKYPGRLYMAEIAPMTCGTLRPTEDGE